MALVLLGIAAAIGLTGRPLPAFAGAACPSSDACLIVTVVGTPMRTSVVTLGDIDEWHDLVDPQFQTNNNGRIQDDPRPSQATSVTSVLSHLAGLTPNNLDHVVARAKASASGTTLSGPQLTTGYQSDLVPAFFGEQPFLRFIRPMRSPSDQNTKDVWSSDAGGAAQLVVYPNGAIQLAPTIVASLKMPDPGEQVTFRATFDGPQPADPTYAWDFGDGTTSTDVSPSHAWAQGATGYDVTLVVSGSDPSFGTTDVVIQVGAPPPPPPSPTAAPGTGLGPSNAPVTGPHTGTGTTQGGSGTSSGNASGGSSTSAAGATKGPGSIKKPSSGKKPKGKPTTTRVGEQVSGTLLVADTVELAAPNASSAKSPAPSRAVPSLSWDRRGLWALLLPALLLVGGVGQSRWLLRRLPVLPWRHG